MAMANLEELIRNCGLKERLEAAIPNIEKRIGCNVTVVASAGQPRSFWVFLDATVKCNVDQDKAYICNHFEDCPVIRHLSASFSICEADLHALPDGELVKEINKLFAETVENMVAINLYDTQPVLKENR